MNTKNILLLSFVLFSSNLFAQGIKVVYQEEMRASVQINGSGGTSSKQGSVSKKEMVLLYNKGESIYEPIANKSEEEALPVQDNPGMKIVMMGNDVKVYKNQKTKEAISEDFIMGKRFLIVDSLMNFDWQLINEEMEINGHKCKKATDKSGQMTAWYCPDIPVNDGPYIFWGLPGLIIQLEHQNKRVTAIDVAQINDAEDQIEKPKDGKKVTQKEFGEIMMKKMKEMGIPSTGGPSVKVNIIQR